ncbi:MAG: LysR family transcriptional regulator [Lachnospiraceae bacterium]|nr:LysR family transcriptional regulator [Lachnospiraceae bacterium]
MRDSDWKILDSLQRTGNITKTAMSLCLSQSAVTKRVQMMESELNVRILIRTSKGVFLTPAGQYLAGKAGEHMDFMEKVRRDLREMPDL